jgi:arabinose-5-phosphate isomerase
MGDALAVALLESKGFKSKDFAKYHPGGSLGKKLYLRVRNLVENNAVPKINSNASIQDAIIEISEKRLGATAVLDNENIIGIITDGDIRRMLKNNTNFNHLTAKDIMSNNPKTIDIDAMAVDALQRLEENNISQIVVTENNKYVGLVHLHELLKEGII